MALNIFVSSALKTLDSKGLGELVCQMWGQVILVLTESTQGAPVFATILCARNRVHILWCS